MAAIYPGPGGPPGGDNNNDPLFDALKKYITTDNPGNSSDDIQKLINEHLNAPGGREYLESIVAGGNDASGKSWKHQQMITSGHAEITNFSFKFEFTVPTDQGDLRVTGNASNSMGMGSANLDGAKFVYDDLQQVRSEQCSFRAEMRPQGSGNSVLRVEFLSGNNPTAVLEVSDQSTLMIPPFMTGEARLV